jgi:hypothetical protein
MIRLRLALIVLVTVAAAALPTAERMGYPPEEFAARRQQLAKVLQRGTLLMFGGTSPIPGVRFRQDNDFFYLTGNESFNGVLVMDAASGVSHLFLPKLSATEIRYEGGNWLDEPDAAKKYGFATIQPLSALHEFLARRRASGGTGAGVDSSFRTRSGGPRPARHRDRHCETTHQSVRAAAHRGCGTSHCPS